MKITITSTSRHLSVDDIELQIWEGETENGVPCFVFVRHIIPQSDKAWMLFTAEVDAAQARGACGLE